MDTGPKVDSVTDSLSESVSAGANGKGLSEGSPAKTFGKCAFKSIRFNPLYDNISGDFSGIHDKKEGDTVQQFPSTKETRVRQSGGGKTRSNDFPQYVGWLGRRTEFKVISFSKVFQYSWSGPSNFPSSGVTKITLARSFKILCKTIGKRENGGFA